jgi:magnesium transporter
MPPTSRDSLRSGDRYLLVTVGEHAERAVPTARPDDRAGEVRRSIEGHRFASASDVAVLREGRLVGLLRIEDVLAAPADARVADLMDADPAVIAPGVDRERAAWHAVRHGDASLAVLDATGAFLGLVPPERLMAVLLEEHAEDVARMSGYLHVADRARSAAVEPVWRRFLHRLPWLLVGLAGAYAAAHGLDAQAAVLRAHVVLAFFLPGIVYIADAVGTQTEALVIRGLAVGVGVGRIVLLEAATGFLVGLVLAGLSYVLTMSGWGQPAVAWVVSLAIVVSCTLATLVAAGLPLLLSRLGLDPAFGSGPVATVVQDLLSIVVYMAIALAWFA